MNIILALLSTLVIIFVIPVLVYGLFSTYLGLKEPEKKLSFFVSVLVQKVGTSFGFVVIYYLGKANFESNWLIYSLVWVGMFAIVEVGQALIPNYSKKEALAGIISEVIYFPLAGLVMVNLL